MSKNKSKNTEITEEKLPPIPNKEELQTQFNQFLDQLNLPKEKRDGMMAMPDPTKWLLICQHKAKHQMMDQSDAKKTPQNYVDLLSKDPQLNDIIGLRVSLTSEEMNWVSEFVKKSGHELLLNILSKIHNLQPSDSKNNFLIESIRAMKALMNNGVGLNAVLEKKDSIYLLTKSVLNPNEKIRGMVMELLAAVSHIRYDVVYSAIIRFATENLQIQFSFIVVTIRDHLMDFELIRVCMTLINSLIWYHNELEKRVHIRHQFINLGLLELLSEIKKGLLDELDSQIQIFEDNAKEDDAEIQTQYGSSQFDVGDAGNMAIQFAKEFENTKTPKIVIEFFRHLIVILFKTEYDIEIVFKTLNEMAQYAVNSGDQVSNFFSLFLFGEKKQEYSQLAESLTKMETENEWNSKKISELQKLLRNRSMDFDKSLQNLKQEYNQKIQIGNKEIEQIDSQIEVESKRHKQNIQEIKEAHQLRVKKLKEKIEQKKNQLERKKKQKENPEQEIDLDEDFKRKIEEEIKKDIEKNIQKEIEEKLRVEYESKTDKLEDESNELETMIMTIKAERQTEIQKLREEITKITTEIQNKDDEEKNLQKMIKNPSLIKKNLGDGNNENINNENVNENVEVKMGGPPPPMGGPPPPMGGPPPPMGGPPPPMGGPPPPMGGPPPPMGGPPPPMGGPPPPMGGPPPPMGGPPPPMGGPPPPMGGPPPPMGGPPPPMGGPPPPMGGPPMGGPPPPMGGPGLRGKPKKKSIKPPIPLKQLHWAKIPDIKVDNTIWKDLNDDNVEFDKDEFANFFNVKKIPVDENKEKEPAKKKKIQLVDPKKSNNVAIILPSFKMSHQEIRKAILLLDESKLTKQNVKSLKESLPTTEEAELLTSFAGDVNDLAECEKFYLQIVDIPRLEQRINAFLFEMNFDESINDILPEIKAIEQSLSQLKKSENFKLILKIVLKLGNYMNGGTSKGGVYGFKLGSLNKIKDTKGTVNPKITLLHWIASFVESKYPDAINFIDDLSFIEKASRVSEQQISSNIRDARMGLKKLQTELPQHQIPFNDDDKFYEKMNSFYEKADEKFTQIEKRFEDIMEEYQKILEYYGETNKNLKPEDFFGQINTFVQDFSKCYKENQKFKEEEEKAAKSKERSGRKLTKPQRTLTPRGNQKGVLDNILAEMKSGQAFRGRGGARKGRGPPQVKQIQPKEQPKITDFRSVLKKTSTKRD